MNLSLVLSMAALPAMIAAALIPIGAVPVTFRIALVVFGFTLLIASVAVGQS